MKLFNPIDYLGNSLSIETTEIVIPKVEKAFSVNYLFEINGRKECGGSVQLDLKLAHRIAFSEAFERKCFLGLNEGQKIFFEADLYPTTCGFAAGFDSEKTKLRSLAESVS